MRILHCFGTLLPNHDGVTRVAYKMRELFTADHEHLYVSPMLQEPAPPNMFLVPSVPFPFSTNYRLAIGARVRIARILDEQRPDVVHIHSPCTLGFAAVRAARSRGIPVVATYHTHFPTYLRYYKVPFLAPLAWSYLRWLYGQCEQVIVPSKHTLAALAARGFTNLLHVPHGVDVSRFSPAHRHPALRRRWDAFGKTVVTFAGRLVWEKNLRLLAAAAEELRDRDDLQFVVVGDGPARAQLEKLMPRAHFTGFLTGSALSEAYASSDLFVFPSLTETFGNVIVEAMASGLPVVAAASGGAQDMINSGENGLLVSGTRATELAQAIDRAADEIPRMAGAAWARAQTFKWEETVGRYESLYENVRYGYRPHAAISLVQDDPIPLSV